MSRETEFLTRHRDDLKRGAELCRLLQSNAVELKPRERNYIELQKICRRLEETCRQMAHERGDDFTWLELGNHYHKVSRLVHKLRRSAKWLRFGEVAQIFDLGLCRVDQLAHQATGRTSRSASPLLILPRHLRHEAPANGLLVP